jgi:hypothetical protein
MIKLVNFSNDNYKEITLTIDTAHKAANWGKKSSNDLVRKCQMRDVIGMILTLHHMNQISIS